MTKRAAIYARVSTDEQAETGYGLPYQIDRCIEHADRRGLRVIETVTDDYTGKTAFRPGMNKLLDLITEQKIQVIIVHRTDRLGRRAGVQDLLEAEIEARGAQVEYVTSSFDRTTPVGRAMRRVGGAFDQLDYENIVERLKENKVEAARRGSNVATRPPYGYYRIRLRGDDAKPITRLEVNEEEARIVRMIYDWYINGDDAGRPLSLLAISKRPTTLGVSTRADARRRALPDGVWGESTVRALLTAEAYTGTWHYGKRKSVPLPGTDKMTTRPAPRYQWVSVPVPAILDRAIVEAAQERIQTNKLAAKRNRKRLYLFSGMLKCNACNCSFVGHPGDGRPRYYCRHCRRASGPCCMPEFREAMLDAAIWPWIREVVCQTEAVAEAIEQRQTKRTPVSRYDSTASTA